ncbi:MAG: methyl-accepting chemotaxis protein [Spirochaetes bacterium]|nr:methyl-accepting chemotaxis protein [Spirochaetota bacterium]
MSLKRKITLIIFFISITIIILFVFTFLFLTRELISSLINDNLIKGSKNFLFYIKENPELINELLNFNRESSYYYKILNFLDEICSIFNFRYIYIFKPSDQGFVFLISNDRNSSINKSNFFWIYYDAPPEMEKAYYEKREVFLSKPYKDQFGEFVALFCPITKLDKVQAIVGFYYDIDFVNNFYRRFYFYAGFIVFFVLTVIYIFTFFIQRKIVFPLKKVSQHTGHISKGFLQKFYHKDNNENNEINVLIKNINIMVDNFKIIIEHLNNTTQKLKYISNKNNDVVEDFIDSFNYQALSIEKISSSIRKATKNIKEIEQYVTENTIIIHEGNKKAFDAKNYIDRMINAMNNIYLSSKNLKKTLKIIYDITDETNLLALNAAIEATKAGKMGVGFAVVATEIKNLSDKASQMLVEIENSIKENDKIINEALNLVNDSKNKLNNIIEINLISSKILDNIKNNISENVNSAENITKAIEEINEIAQNYLKNSKEIEILSYQISNISEEINENIKKFQYEF